MIESIVLLSLGAFGALYVTHKTFREKVNDVCSHVSSLVIRKPKAPAPPSEPAAIAAKPGETLQVSGNCSIAPVPPTTTQ